MLEIAKAITASGGRFLEAPVSGSKGPALNGRGHGGVCLCRPRKLIENATKLSKIHTKVGENR